MLLETRLLMRFAENRSFSGDNKKRVSPTQMHLRFAFDIQLNLIPGNCQKISVRHGRDNGIHDGDRERRI
jgi:hypothetical protein